VDSPQLGTFCWEFVFIHVYCVMCLWILRVNLHKPCQIHIHFCAINKIQTAYFVQYTVHTQFSSMGMRCLNFIEKFKPSKIPTLWDIMTCRLKIDTLMANVPSSSGLSSSFQIMWISSYTSDRVLYIYSLILWKFINTLFSGKLFYFCTLSTY
jgi:hypothetical protein